MNVTTKLHQIKLGTCDDCRWNALGKRGEPDDRDDNNDASSEWMSVIAVLVLNVVMIMEMRSGKDERDQRDVLFNYFLGPDLDHVHWIHLSLWCHVLKNLASSHFISEENTKKGKKTNHEGPIKNDCLLQRVWLTKTVRYRPNHHMYPPHITFKPKNK